MSVRTSGAQGNHSEETLWGEKSNIGRALSLSFAVVDTRSLVRSQRAALPRGFASEPHSVDVDRLFKPLAMTERTEAPATGMKAAARRMRRSDERRWQRPLDSLSLSVNLSLFFFSSRGGES